LTAVWRRKRFVYTRALWRIYYDRFVIPSERGWRRV